MSEHVSIERMHDLLDGLLPADEAGRVRTHVDRCAACAAERAALARTLEGLRSLPRDAAAPEGAWADIERRIAGGTPPAGARVGEVLEFPTARAAARRLSLTVPQAVAAALTISLVSAGTAWTLRSGPPGDGPPPAAAALEAPAGATEGTR
ncbi:MAG TPA: zf-HC2 domain-containing protein, partial [Longimicrobiales bacterium]|nr:zf-HC2 domain-containing protein [Longimicrobiales bacterium]